MVIKTTTLKLASAGIIFIAAGIWWSQRDPGPQQPTATTTTTKKSGAAGVRPDTFDPARRTGDDDDAANQVANASSATPVADDILAAMQQAERDATPTPPSEPILPTAYAIAASEGAQAVQADVLAQVQGLVSDQHQNLRNSCWTGNVPASAVFPMSATFGEDGNMLALSITDDRSAPQVGACVRSQPWALKVDPPGVKVTVELPIELP